MITTPCGHVFHFLCLEEAIKAGNLTCPNCRGEIGDFIRAFRRVTLPDPAAMPSPPSLSLHPYLNASPVMFSTPVTREVPPDQAPPTVSSLPSSSTLPVNDARGEVQLAVTLEQDALPLSAPQAHELTAMIRLTGLQHTGSSSSHLRPPVDVVLVLDTSGSMAGTKISLLQQAVNFIINQLTEVDRLGIVIFNTNAFLAGDSGLRCMDASGKNFFLERLSTPDFIATGATDIRAGLLLAQRMLTQRVHRENRVTSVLLLTDGQDSRPWSARDVDWSVLREQRCSLNLFGFGEDHDSNLLSSIATETAGVFAYVENPTLLGEYFGHCLGGLISQVASEIKVTVTPGDGHQIVRSLSSGPGIQFGPFLLTWTLVGLSDQQNKDLLFRLQVPVPSPLASSPSLEVQIEYLPSHSSQNQRVTSHFSLPQIPRRDHPPPTPNLEIKVQTLRVEVAESLQKVTRLIATHRAQAIVELERCKQLLDSVEPQLRDHPLVAQLQMDIRECQYRIQVSQESERTTRHTLTSLAQQHQAQRPCTNNYCSPSYTSTTSRPNAYSNVQQHTSCQAYHSSQQP